MKKHLSAKVVVVAYFLISGMLAGCTKEAGVNPGSRQNESTQSLDQSTQKTPPVVNFFKTPLFPR